MQNRAKCFILMFFIFTISCKEKVCVVEYNKNVGSRIIKGHIDKCNNNNIVDEQEFKIGSRNQLVANGYCKNYYADQKLKSLFFFKNGIKDSLANEYYENGNVKQCNYYAHGIYFGPQYHYLMNGKIDFIKFYTQNSINWLTIKYSDKGDMTSVKGNLIHITLNEKNAYFDSVPVQHPLMLLSEVAKVPNARTEINIKIEGKKGSVLDTTITAFLPFFNTYMTGIRHKFFYKGNYVFVTKTSLIDSASDKKLYIDSFSKKMVVY
jgi:hypothetical protein